MRQLPQHKYSNVKKNERKLIFFVKITSTSFQTYRDCIDPWLVLALVSMVIAKIVTHVYSDRNL